MYRIQQFARLAGVTVRTLRHYDRLGLLQPGHRTSSGYRLYSADDLPQLERILVLRYLGLGLAEIGELLPRCSNDSLRQTFAAQTRVLRARRDGLNRMLHTIQQAQLRLEHGDTGLALLPSILKEIQMQQDTNWTEHYYSPEAQDAIAAGPQWTPELQAETTAAWQTLFADVEAAIARDIPKSSAEAKALAERWMALVGRFTQGNPAVLEGLNRMYADRDHWPEASKANNPVKPEWMQWIREVQQA